MTGQTQLRSRRYLSNSPVDLVSVRWQADRAAMLELPPVDPVVEWRLTTSGVLGPRVMGS